MIKFKYKINPTSLVLGGLIVTIAGVLLAIGDISHAGRLFIFLCILLFGIGVIISLSGIFEVYARHKLISRWDDSLIKKALRAAPPKTKIRILQTWLPDREHFCAFLRDLLLFEGKQFKIEILLMTTEKKYDEILKARIALRGEDYMAGENNINGTINLLKRLKNEVDKKWKEEGIGAQLDLKIRCYHFLPFGSMYQIGESHFFIGFYINFDSSIYAPMVIIRDPRSRIWKLFNEDFDKGWEQSKEVKL